MSARVRAWLGLAAYSCLNGVAATALQTRNWEIRDRLGLPDQTWGLVLTGGSVGAIVVALTSAWLIARFGSRRTLVVSAVVYSFAVMIPALAGSWWATWLGLFAIGASNFALDVAAAEQVVATERVLGSHMRLGLEAVLSGGWIVAGSLAVVVGIWSVPLTTEMVAVGLTAAALALGASAALLPGTDVHRRRETTRRRWGTTRIEPTRIITAVKRVPPGLWALALLAYVSLFGEAAILNWGATYMHDVFHLNTILASAGVTAFAVAAMAGQAVGQTVLGRLGAYRLITIAGVLTLAGGSLIVLSQSYWLAFAGIALAGLGISPVGALASNTAGERFTGGIPFVSGIGYTAFLTAAPIIGVLAHSTLRVGLSPLLAIGALMVMLARAAREQRMEEMDMNTTRNLTAGVVGSGPAALDSAAAFARNQIQLVACCDADRGRSQELARLFGSQAYATVSDMLAAGVDLLSVCSTDPIPPVLEALGAGRPPRGIICAMPANLTAVQAGDLREGAAASGTTLAFAAGHPAGAWLRPRIQTGVLGTLKAIDVNLWLGDDNQRQGIIQAIALVLHLLDAGAPHRIVASGDERLMTANVVFYPLAPEAAGPVLRLRAQTSNVPRISVSVIGTEGEAVVLPRPQIARLGEITGRAGTAEAKLPDYDAAIADLVGACTEPRRPMFTLDDVERCTRLADSIFYSAEHGQLAVRSTRSMTANQHRVSRLLEQGRADEAVALAVSCRDAYPHHTAEVALWIAETYALVNRQQDAIATLWEMGLRGLWALRSQWEGQPPFQSLRGKPEFETAMDRLHGMGVTANAQPAPTTVKVYEAQEPKGLLLVLHGIAEAALSSAPLWKPATDAAFSVVVPESPYMTTSDGTRGWEDDDRSRAEIARVLAGLSPELLSRPLVLAGFSGGANCAVSWAVRGTPFGDTLPVSAFVAVCPSQDLPLRADDVWRAAQRIRGVGLTGELDWSRARAEALFRRLRAGGVDAQLDVIRGADHGFPPRFADWLRMALLSVLP